MEKCSFFNSINGDRRYKAESWAEQIASYIGNGILANPATNLKVMANENMQIVVKAGRAWINGYFYWNTSDLFLNIETADGVLNRIDRVVIRWSLLDRSISLKVKKGTSGSSPVPPTIQRDADVYELVLANISVKKGTIELVQSNIADTRYLSDICGKVVPLFKELDLTDFYEECSRNMQEQINAWESQTTNQNNTFNNSMSNYTNKINGLETDYYKWKGEVDKWKDDMIVNLANDWEEQSNSQEESFNASMNSFISQVQGLKDDYDTWKNSIDNWRDLTTAELSKVLSFNFENQFAFAGTVKEVEETAKGYVSVIMWKTLGEVFAQQIMEETADGKVEVVQKVFNTDGSVFRNVKKVIVESGSKIISEVVSL